MLVFFAISVPLKDKLIAFSILKFTFPLIIILHLKGLDLALHGLTMLEDTPPYIISCNHHSNSIRETLSSF